MLRRIAYDSHEFWTLFAPLASPSLLAEHLPPAAGGLGYEGWRHAVRRSRLKYPDLPWPAARSGAHVPRPDTWPDPIYEDEVKAGASAVPAAGQQAEWSTEEKIERDRTIHDLRAKNRELQTKYDRSIADQNIYSRLAREGAAVLDPIAPLCEPPVSVGAKRSIRQALVYNWADWHVERQFSADQMDGLNWYDPPTCLRRAACATDKVLMFAGLTDRIAYHTLYIHDFGDNCQNWLHEDDAPTNAMPPLKAARFACELKAACLRDLAPHFERIVFRGVPGNHGRTTKKVAWNLPTQNLDWLVYQWLRDKCRDLTNVTFELADTWSMTADVEGWGFFLNHGTTDAKGGFGGISWYSDQRSDTKRTAIDVKLGRRVLVRQYGHLHTEADTPRAAGNGRIRHEPSLMGGDPFALEGMSGTFSEPAQSLLEVHAEEGLVAERTLDVRKYDLERDCRYDALLDLV